MAIAVAAMQDDVIGHNDLVNAELSSDDGAEGEYASDEDVGDLWEAVEIMAFTDVHQESSHPFETNDEDDISGIW